MAEYDKNWPMPRYFPLDQPVKEGQTLIVKAKVHDINLKDNPEEKEPNIIMDLVGDSEKGGLNIPLHCRIHFNKEVIALNSLINGEWGKGEQHKLVFQLNEAMDLKVRMEKDHFVLLADDKEFAKYNYRLPLSSIKQFEIKGPIDLYGVKWTGNHYSVPYETAFDKFGVGTRLFVSGKPTKDTQFAINLMAENDDIVFHFNPRLVVKTVVRNTNSNKSWGEEELEFEGDFPFFKDVGFDVVIVNQEKLFQVFVNGKPFCTYAHRMDPSLIKKIVIRDDVELYSCAVF